MQKVYSSTLGSYMPSFFYMKLNFPFHNTRLTLYNLAKKDLSTFIHEYIHFIQDISSYSLLNNAYVYSEYMHAAANHIYRLPKGKISIPLRMPTNYGLVDANKFVNATCMGDFTNKASIFALKIEYDHVHVPYTNPIVRYLDIPFIIDADKSRLQFGTCAIMESMAYLIELSITSGSPSPDDYPYQTAHIVAYLEYPQICNDRLNLIALCDASLQFSNPGKIFVETLRKMKKESYLPQKAEDIYNYVYQSPVIQFGQQLQFEIGLLKMGMAVQDRLRLYLNDPMFFEFHETIKYLIGFGIGERLRNPHFIIDLVRDGYALYNNTLHYIMNQVGSPIIIDTQNTYSQIPPSGCKANTSLQYFLAIEQIYKCFDQGSTICEMIDFCDQTIKDAKTLFGSAWQQLQPIMDNNCWDRPWKKICDKRLCPYALLWHHWKLKDWQP